MRVVSLVLALSASSAAALNASYVDHRHLADAGLTCSIQNGVDFSGPDIGNVPGPSAQECCAKCNENPQCGAFTWTGWNGGTCWLKSSKGEARSNPAAQSAEVQTAATCSLETNVGYINNDIGSVYGATAGECCGKCQAHTGCNAFTWTNYMGGTCWLKSGKGDTRPEPGSFSSVVNPPGQCSAEDNTNYNGQDIGSVAGSGAADCCAKCSNRPGCGAYTWTNWNGGTCWLKSGKGSTSYSWGSISGKVTVPSTANHIQPRLRSGEIPLRSVNLGGWLVGEYWMSFTSPAWQDANGVGWDGEYLTMQKFGKEKGTRQFEQHRQTWITEADIAQIAAAGMNAVRVPIGFWIMYDDPSIPDTPISSVFAKGALKYLDTLINRWAVKYNLAVMLSLHAHQGSQNGYDHSSPLVRGEQSWDSNQGNIDNSIQFATFIANRYKNSIAFLGMNLMNEPKWPLSYDALINGYYIPAYNRIRATGNNCILVVSPLMGEQSPPYQMNLMRWPQYNNVWHEFHVYYKWGWEKKNEWEIINAARGYRSSHLDNWQGNYMYMGEWSLAHPDEAPFNDRNTFKEFAAVQLQQYQGAHSGWAFWSWRHDEETQRLSGWSMRQLLREGIFTVPRVN